MKFKQLYTIVAVLAVATSTTFAFAKSDLNGSSLGKQNVGAGNNGNGIGNSGIGNQGNSKDVGSAGGFDSDFGNDNHDNNAGGNNDGNQGHSSEHGNGLGGSSTGNQGNDRDVGNAGGFDNNSDHGNSNHDNNAGGNNDGNQGHSGEHGNGLGGSSTGNQGNDSDHGNAGGFDNDSDHGNGQNNDNNNGHHGEGNHGNGNGNTGDGNQGNDSDHGNSGGVNNDHGNDGDNHDGNNGNGNGNTGDGNQGNDSDHGNAGGGDDDDNNNDDENSEETTEAQANQPEKEEREQKLKAKVLPLAFGNYDVFTKIINLSDIGAMETDDATLQLTSEEEENSYLVVKQRKYNIGLGMSALLSYENASGLAQALWGLIGIAPMKDSNVVFEAIVDSEDEAETFQRKIPFQSTDLDAWKIGESVTYTSNGGVVLTGNLGLAGFGSTLTYIAQGGWKTMIQKTGDKSASVTLLSTELSSLHRGVGAYLMGASLNDVEELANGFTYSFDLNDDLAIEAYERMLGGDLEFIQELTEKRPILTVRKTHQKNQLAEGRKTRTFFGIPFINISTATGRMYELSNNLNLDSNTKLSTEYGVFMDETRGRFIFKHRNVLKAFYGGIATTTVRDQVVDQAYSGEFVWRYESDNSSSSKLRSAINQLQRATGMTGITSVEVPAGEKLKYTEVEFKISMSDAFRNFMMEKSVSDENFLQGFKDAAKASFEKDFSENFEEVCANNVVMNADFHACRDEHETDIYYAFSRMKKALTDMKLNFGADNKEYLKAMAKFGQAVWTNKYVFKTFANTIQSCGSSINFKIKGQKVKQYQKVVNTPLSKSCMLNK